MGTNKTLLAKHLHCWMQQAIFTYDGRLSIGYHYENLVMAEGYNAPGSPYWAFKTFCCSQWIKTIRFGVLNRWR